MVTTPTSHYISSIAALCCLYICWYYIALVLVVINNTYAPHVLIPSWTTYTSSSRRVVRPSCLLFNIEDELYILSYEERTLACFDGQFSLLRLPFLHTSNRNTLVKWCVYTYVTVQMQTVDVHPIYSSRSYMHITANNLAYKRTYTAACVSLLLLHHLSVSLSQHAC